MIPPSTAFFNLIRDFNPIREQTSPQITKAFGAYGNQVLLQFKRFFSAKNSDNPVENLASFFANLDKELASIDDKGIVAGWCTFFNKYQSPSVKTRTLSKLGTAQFLDKSFPSTSNHLISPQNIYSQNVAGQLPQQNSKIPNMISTGGMSLPGYIQTNLVQANHLLGEIFKGNMAPGLGKLAKSTDAHQGNLVPDAKHPERIGAAATKFVKGVVESYGKAANFMAQNLGFNGFSVQNTNVSSPNYKINTISSAGQTIRMNSFGVPETKDSASLERFKTQRTA
jgi:hypothetical protein